jgi:hypothetical protein
MMAFGIAVGYEPWWHEGNGLDAFTPDAGSITNNTISGAVVNLAIEGIGAGYVADNTMSGHQGSFGFGCSLSMDYSAHFFGTATIQPGWSTVWFFGDRCGTWNDFLPRPDDPGALAHSRSLAPNQTLTSSDGSYQLTYQGDGNLVLTNAAGEPLWWEPGAVGDPIEAKMQEDANFVVRANGCIWSTRTNDADKRGSYLVVQNDGNVVVYFLDGRDLWNLFTNPYDGCQ